MSGANLPRGRVYDWLQAVLACHHLVLVPLGDRAERRWARFEQPVHELTVHELTVHELTVHELTVHELTVR